MDLKDIAAVSGKGGLFKVLKPTRTGVILESIDLQKNKLIANARDRVSLLKEISVYTTTKESSIPLEDVFATIYTKFGTQLNVSSKSSDQDLKSFLEGVVPEYDKERVYNSDIKKIVNWYGILSEHLPEVFEKAPESSQEVAQESKEGDSDKTAAKTTKKEAKSKPVKKEVKETSAGEKEKPKAKSTAKKKDS